MSEKPEEPLRQRRVVVAAALSIVAGVIAWFLHSRAGFHPDYVFAWQAARHLLAGTDPYAALPGGLPEPFESPLLYPLPTVIAAVPFAPLSLPVASAITMALSAGLLAFALTSRSWEPLWILASAPFVMAVNLGQWSPLVTVAALIPSLGFLAILKPNLGLAAFAWRPDWRMVAGVFAVAAVSVMILPGWPAEWLEAVRTLPGHPVPLLSGHGAGVVLLLAALRWRTAEGRLLLAMSCVPQLLFFADQLPLLLVARTALERKVMVAVSLVACVAWYLRATATPGAAYVPLAEPYVLLGCYLPALVIVLRRRGGPPVPQAA